jgi:hypothetical protein
MDEKCSLIASVYNSDVGTNLGFLCEKGHKEPWIIVMNDVTTKSKIRDDRIRDGIDCLFSDLNGRCLTCNLLI